MYLPESLFGSQTAGWGDGEMGRWKRAKALLYVIQVTGGYNYN